MCMFVTTGFIINGVTSVFVLLYQYYCFLLPWTYSDNFSTTPVSFIFFVNIAVSFFQSILEIRFTHFFLGWIFFHLHNFIMIIMDIIISISHHWRVGSLCLNTIWLHDSRSNNAVGGVILFDI